MVLREFMDRVTAVNTSKEYAFKVKDAVLFGSMLSCGIGWVMLMSPSIWTLYLGFRQI